MLEKQLHPQKNAAAQQAAQQAATAKMHELGLYTCGDMQKYTVAELARWFGSRAQDLFDLARGHEERPVESRMLRIREHERSRGFVVKLKFYDFKSTTHEMASRAWPTIADFQGLLTRAWGRRGEPVRLIGIGVRLAGEPALPDEKQMRWEI